MPKGSVPRLVSDPGEIGRVPSAPPLVLPAAPEVFSLRAERLEALAPGQPFATFLRFMAALARAQRAVLARLPPPPPTATRALSNRPLLDRRSLLASTLWEDALGTIADALGSAALPAEAASVLSALLARPQAERARFAARIVDRHVAVEETAEAVFLVAALQTVWTREASALSASAAAAREMTACPVCGGLPFASLVCASGERSGLRYLVCSLCASQWRHVRIKCTACGNGKGIAYHAVAGGEGPAKAETCEECKAYTKVVDAERDEAAEPMADDLASLPLDVLMNESGWRRAFPNPFLAPGIA